MCDGGKEIRAKQEARKAFAAMSAKEQLDNLYLRIIDIQERLDRLPYNGPIG